MSKKGNSNFSNQELLNKLIYAQSAIECGVHSGFPSCCIKFFVTEKLWMDDKRLQNYLLKIHYSETKNKRWGYIPCPKCLSKMNGKKRIVEGSTNCEFEIIQPETSSAMLQEMVTSDPETLETKLCLAINAPSVILI